MLLRLATSDSVLDEPDDFDINDLHAQAPPPGELPGCWKPRFAVSSATLPPRSYPGAICRLSGRAKIWQASWGQRDRPVNICCAWFEEKDARAEQIADGPSLPSGA